MDSIKNKVVLITGSSRGIGRAAAFKFAARGAKVVITGRDEKSLSGTLSELKNAFPQGEFLSCSLNLGELPSITELFQNVNQTFGTVDILVNNGAIGYRTPLLGITEEVWDNYFRINVKGLFFCAQMMMSRLIAEKKPGLIINLSSLGGVRSTEKFPGMTPYVATKFAVAGITEALAAEGKPYGIRVNAIAPGAVNTEMLRKAAPDLKTNTEPEDIADLILNLCENSARSLSGTILEVYSNA
jgi:NAD(P)-dependent dehydrogenase (short-subunit alcohol dehydrogenase family)